MKTLSAWLVIAAVPLLADGCTGTVKAISCSSNDDCPTGSVCQPDNTCSAVSDGGGADSGTDLTFDLGDGPVCGSGVVCGVSQICCAAGEICGTNGACQQPANCSDDNDCSGDTYCDNGLCIPWGTGPRGPTDPACTMIVPIGLFSPAEQCSWTGPPAGDAFPMHANVLATPTVADFDFDNNANVRKPSIVFTSYDGEDGGGGASNCTGGKSGIIRVIDGETCAQLYTIDAQTVRAAAPLALADINLDGRPDIVASKCGGGLVAFSYDPATDAFVILWTSVPDNLFGSSAGWAGPSVHDLDNDGTPEILLWGTVWDNTGMLLDQSLGLLDYSAGWIPVAADLDGDGNIELADGDKVWRWSGGQWTEIEDSANSRGFVAVADFGTYGSDPNLDDRTTLDGISEVAVVRNGNVRVQTLQGRVVFSVAVPGSDPGTGGPPTIGDFDNDGRVEVAAAAKGNYAVYDPDCPLGIQSTSCVMPAGVLWTQVSQDFSSSVTGSSIFDFDGDGAAEAVYADECFTRVYDGTTGEVLYSQWRSSCTWYENPIVADVDGDFNSELVVPSNTNCNIQCTTNPAHDTHPVSGQTLDPLFKGLRCQDPTDCLSGTCDAGFCRCANDSECGGGGFVCGPAVAGTSGSGDVCRAAFLGDTSGVLVYRDVLDRWVSSRMIWNQHAYSVTNINEDGTVPQTSAWLPNWTQAGLNNYRQNVQGDLQPDASPDLTVQRLPTPPCDANGDVTLTVKLCNRGTEPIGQGVSTAFYEGSVAGALICVAQNPAQLPPGDCVDLSCLWSNVPSAPTDVYVVADDDGTGAGSTSECKEGNNLAVLEGVRCQPVQ